MSDIGKADQLTATEKERFKTIEGFSVALITEEYFRA